MDGNSKGKTEKAFTKPDVTNAKNGTDDGIIQENDDGKPSYVECDFQK